jgi:hypothetical protein
MKVLSPSVTVEVLAPEVKSTFSHPFNPAEKSPLKIRLAADAGFADSDRTIIEASFTVMFFMFSPDILFGIAEKAVQIG